jgi:hypothetical protein
MKNDEIFDIEKDEDIPIFSVMDRCLKELLDLSNNLTEEDLQRGYRIAKCKNTPPKLNEIYYDLTFKKRKK